MFENDPYFDGFLNKPSKYEQKLQYKKMKDEARKKKEKQSFIVSKNKRKK